MTEETGEAWADRLDRLDNLLFLLRFDDEPEPPRLSGRIQYWHRDAKGIMKIREEALRPDQMVLEPRLTCPPQ